MLLVVGLLPTYSVASSPGSSGSPASTSGASQETATPATLPPALVAIAAGQPVRAGVHRAAVVPTEALICAHCAPDDVLYLLNGRPGPLVLSPTVSIDSSESFGIWLSVTVAQGGFKDHNNPHMLTTKAFDTGGSPHTLASRPLYSAHGVPARRSAIRLV